jgi:hypothetical protein
MAEGAAEEGVGAEPAEEEEDRLGSFVSVRDNGQSASLNQSILPTYDGEAAAVLPLLLVLVPMTTRCPCARRQVSKCAR